jgi:hypothetical protein
MTSSKKDAEMYFPATMAGLDRLDAALSKMSLSDKEAVVENFLKSSRFEKEDKSEQASSPSSITSNAMEHSGIDERHEIVGYLRKVIKKHGVLHVFESFNQKTMDNLDVTSCGSGPLNMPLNQLFCAGMTGQSLPCSEKATHQCANCKLIKYCSRDCQRNHWSQHKLECKGPLNSKDWKPLYLKEGREPVFINCDSSRPLQNKGRVDFFWGNTPAMDLFRFSEMESKSSNLSVLFAASGDLRNFFSSFVGLPQDFKPALEVVLNDLVPKVAARNFVMLYLLLKLGENGIDLVINLWYSTALTATQNLLLTREVCDVFKDIKPEQFPESKRFVFGSVQLTVQFERKVWLSIFQMISMPIAMEALVRSRNEIMLQPTRRDYQERHLYRVSPAERLSMDYFRHHGLLLPSGAFSGHMTDPNTSLLDPEFGWTLTEAADPIEGWDLRQVHQTAAKYNVSKSDHYGALFFHLREIMTDFVAKSRHLQLSIKLMSDDLSRLGHLKGASFSRIDVSNVSDENYLGIKKVLQVMSPLLSTTNPEAVLITTFMNWMPDAPHSFLDELVETEAKKCLDISYLKTLSPSSIPSQAELNIKLLDDAYQSVSWLYNDSKDFDAFIKSGVQEGERLGLHRRSVHKIVPKRIGWSMDSQKQDDLPELSEEDRHLLSNVGSYTGFFRYVEWSRSASG